MSLDAVACFLAAALVFFIQPVVARMLLPHLGGAAAVWTTSMVFFQSALLAGYAWAHGGLPVRGIPGIRHTRRHAAVHVALLAVGLVVLPPALGHPTPPAGDPTRWLLGLMVASLGLPVVLVSATAPLIQRWAAARGTVGPYKLYAASNAGSLLALGAYPTVVEPTLGLRAQALGWTVAYGLLVALTAACALRLPAAYAPDTPRFADEVASPGFRVRIRWALLAFVPASLLFGVTTYITTDLAAVPLLWTLPLAIYIGSFVVVFSRRDPAPGVALTAGFAGLAVLLFVFTLPRLTPGYFLAALHLLLLLLGALAYHGELARIRPAPVHLTNYYLSVSAGGAVAGALCALVAPRVFSTVTEYPLAIALAVGLLPHPQDVRTDPHRGAVTWRDVAIPVGVGLVARGIFDAGLHGAAGGLATFGLPVALCAVLSAGRRGRVALGLLAIVAASGREPATVFRTRSFYSVLRVERADGYTTLLDGTTVHGQQSLDPAARMVPTAYYARQGPIGQLFSAWENTLGGADIAVVGMGAGTIAAYALPGQHWTFYELDPAVASIARTYFTFIPASTGVISVVIGDARLRLGESPPGRFRLLVLDAFSSDAVPVHLLTREALALDVSRLTPHGTMVVNLTNRYVRLDGVLAAAARDLGLRAWIQRDRQAGPRGRVPSTWAVLARSAVDVGAIATDPRWQALTAPAEQHAWTDDHAGLLGVLRRPWP